MVILIFKVLLYRILDHLRDLKDIRPGKAGNDNRHTHLLQLSDHVQQLHSTCAIYAENISPHSKFRYR